MFATYLRVLCYCACVYVYVSVCKRELSMLFLVQHNGTGGGKSPFAVVLFNAVDFTANYDQRI